MVVPFSVSRSAVRRFLLHTQFLLPDSIPPSHSDGKEATMELIRALECVQLDPVSAVERNQHLVLATRKPDYDPEQLNQLLAERRVFEYFANAVCAIPMEDYAVVEPIRERIRARVEGELEGLGPVVQEVLKRLEEEGPLPSRAFRSTKRVHGYWDNVAPKTKETSLALNLLLDAASIQVVAREGSERFFDVTERAIPEEKRREAEAVGTEEARRLLIEKYMRAYRVFDVQDQRFGWTKLSAADRRAEVEWRVQAGTVVPLDMEGVKRTYYILAEDLEKMREFGMERDEAPLEGPIRFLPPLDNLLWRRERLVDLFDFDYKWEIYIPESKRRFGYYAMPILYGDRLIGRMDPRLDRKEGKLVVRLLQLENGVRVTPQLRKRLKEALKAFAKFHGVSQLVVPPF